MQCPIAGQDLLLSNRMWSNMIKQWLPANGCAHAALFQKDTLGLVCFNLFFFLFLFFLTLQYCINFVKHQKESATGIPMLPILNPPPSSLPIPSLWVVPVHQPQVSSFVHQTWTGDSFHTWYYTCFNAILPNLPPSPSPTESIRLIYISVSLLLSRIQGYCYHLSTFHIYAFVYCIGDFLSGLLHSV